MREGMLAMMGPPGATVRRVSRVSRADEHDGGPPCNVFRAYADKADERDGGPLCDAFRVYADK